MCEPKTLADDKYGAVIRYRSCFDIGTIKILIESIIKLTERRDPGNVSAYRQNYAVYYVADDDMYINYANSVIQPDGWTRELEYFRDVMTKFSAVKPNMLTIYRLNTRQNNVPGISFDQIVSNTPVCILTAGTQPRELSIVANPRVRSSLKNQTLNMFSGDILITGVGSNITGKAIESNNFANNHSLAIPSLPVSDEDGYAFVLVFESRFSVEPPTIGLETRILTPLNTVGSSFAGSSSAGSSSASSGSTSVSSGVRRPEVVTTTSTYVNVNPVRTNYGTRRSRQAIAQLFEPRVYTDASTQITEVSVVDDGTSDFRIKRALELSRIASREFRPVSTYPLTKFEHAAIIGARAEMLENGIGPGPLIDTTGLINANDIAAAEFLACKLDFLIVEREYGNVIIQKSVTELQPGCD